MTNRQPRRAARETTIGDQRTGLAQPHGFQIAGRIEHFLHARTAFGAFVADDNNVAFLDLTTKNLGNGFVLAFADHGRAGEFQNAFIHATSLNDATIDRHIAKQNGQPTILTVGVLNVTNATFFFIKVQVIPITFLAERCLRRHATGHRTEELVNGVIRRALDVPFFKGIGHGFGVNRRNVGMEQTSAFKFT